MMREPEVLKIWDAVPGFDLITEVDLPEFNSLFFDGTHSVPLLTPLYSWFWIRHCGYGSQYIAELFSTPRFKGFGLRNGEGSDYIGMYIVRDEEEVKRRTEKFKEALRPWIENFSGIWDSQKQELVSLYKKMAGVRLDGASPIDLMHYLWDMISMNRRMWEIHFQGMYMSYAAFMACEEALKPYGYSSESPQFQAMFRGFDNKVYQVDKKMCALAKEAIDMGLDGIIMNTPTEDVLAKLEQEKNGKEWLKKLKAFLEEEGWRMVRMMDLNCPYWLEDPKQTIPPIRAFIKKGGQYDLDQIRDRLAREREEAIKDVLGKVPEQEREYMEQLIRLGGHASSFSEEHDLFCELYCHAVMRYGFLGIGRRLAKAGTLDDPEDIFFLNPDEIERVMFVPEYHKMQWIVNRRKARWRYLNENWHQVKDRTHPPVYTTRKGMEEAVAMDLLPSADPIIIKIVVGELPRVRPELKADLYGVCGSPGVAEGRARVCMTYGEIDSIQRDEILVCPGTDPAWTPVFGIVKAVVTDRGGTLSHAAIIGREFGIPVLVNTFKGTSVVKTGDRVRVDATEGALYILEKGGD